MAPSMHIENEILGSSCEWKYVLELDDVHVSMAFWWDVFVGHPAAGMTFELITHEEPLFGV